MNHDSYILRNYQEKVDENQFLHVSIFIDSIL
jgi:hypothetical protein